MRGRVRTRLFGPRQAIALPIRAETVPTKGPQDLETVYVMLKTKAGNANSVARAISSLNFENARIIACDTITGPFDVMVYLGAQSLEALGNATVKIVLVNGIERSAFSRTKA